MAARFHAAGVHARSGAPDQPINTVTGGSA